MDPLHQWFAEALAMQRQGNASGAALTWRRLLSRFPENQDGWINYGSVLRELGRHEEAREAQARATTLGPENVALLLLRANLLYDVGLMEEAIGVQRRAVALAPESLEARLGLGRMYHRLGRGEEALAADAEALALAPNHPGALVNHSASLLRQQRTKEAIEDCRRAIEHAPDHPLAHLNLGIALLLDGQLEEGFREYEWRWQVEEVRPFDPGFAEPRWEGEPFEGKTLLLWAEQGLGDTLMALRAVRGVKARGGKVVLSVQGPLVDLARSAGADEVVSEEGSLPPFDLQAPLMSLFHILGPVPERMAPVPYLVAPQSAPHAAAINGRLAGCPGRKVGLVWAGNPVHRDNAYRRLDPAALDALAALPGITWVSLQRWEDGAAPPGPHLPRVDLGDLLGTFADTAHALSRLDLFVSIDTSVLHLAGALGRPALALLAQSPDWRWQLRREDSPWYPTLRLLRQPAPGDWAGLARKVAEALA